MKFSRLDDNNDVIYGFSMVVVHHVRSKLQFFFESFLFKKFWAEVSNNICRVLC